MDRLPESTDLWQLVPYEGGMRMIQNGDILDGMYQIVQEIGQGGTGIIYLAQHLRLDKRVVVKKVKDHFAGQINGRAEVDILKRLHHTYLPQVYDFLVVDSSIYTVMEYIEGNDLQYYLNQGYRFPEETLRKWLLQLTEVLEYLHSQTPPILHSDIKPANIMITKQGNVCLIDFNISLDGETSKDIQGISPWFAAPEQYAKVHAVLYGEPDKTVLDGRMDLYSLGATFYTVMTGLLPRTEQETDISKMNLAYSEGLKSVIARAMKWNVNARFRSAKQMKKALQDVSRMDPKFRKYECLQILTGFGYFLCVLAGCLCIYYGNWKNTEESWQQDHQELFLAAEEGNTAEVIVKATRMLNDSEYQNYLKKETVKQAEILHVLGESYFQREDYIQAASYYREAWELQKKSETYCLDYVVAVVRSENISEAEILLNSREIRRLLSMGVKSLIRAEIAHIEGDNEEAQTQLKVVLDYPEEVGMENWLRGHRLLAEIYVSQKEYEQAADCYEILRENQALAYEDYLNLALLQRVMEQYAESNLTLQEMETRYWTDYTTHMWKCWNYLDLAKKKKRYSDVEEKLRAEYAAAKQQYEESNADDENMEELKGIMEKLEKEPGG